MELVPVVYEHAAKFLGERPWNVSRSADLLGRSHAAAYRSYGQSPVMVGIDIYNVEPEAYGALVKDAGGNEVPSVEGRLCASAADILQLPAYEIPAAGRIGLVLEAARAIRHECPSADVRIPMSGPFSIAASLVGFQQVLMEMLEDPETVGEALARLARDQVDLCRHYASEGFRVMVVESSASPPLVSPVLFDSVLLPSLMLLVGEGGAATGEPLPLILGGDTVRILPSLLRTGTRYLICPAETAGERFMAIAGEHPDVAVRINLNPVLFSSTNTSELRAALDAAIGLAEGRGNVSIGTGVLPYDALETRVLEAKRYLESVSTDREGG